MGSDVARQEPVSAVAQLGTVGSTKHLGCRVTDDSWVYRAQELLSGEEDDPERSPTLGNVQDLVQDRSLHPPSVGWRVLIQFVDKDDDLVGELPVIKSALAGEEPIDRTEHVSEYEGLLIRLKPSDVDDVGVATFKVTYRLLDRPLFPREPIDKIPDCRVRTARRMSLRNLPTLFGRIAFTVWGWPFLTSGSCVRRSFQL